MTPTYMKKRSHCIWCAFQCQQSVVPQQLQKLTQTFTLKDKNPKLQAAKIGLFFHIQYKIIWIVCMNENIIFVFIPLCYSILSHVGVIDMVLHLLLYCVCVLSFNYNLQILLIHLTVTKRYYFFIINSATWKQIRIQALYYNNLFFFKKTGIQ